MIATYKALEVNLEKISYSKISAMLQNYEKATHTWTEHQLEDFCCCKIVQLDYYAHSKFDGA